MAYWQEGERIKEERRAANGKTVTCATCGATVFSTMRRGPPRGWIAHPTRIVTEELAPGVPWTYAEPVGLHLALKSGNFGARDFFLKAFEAP